MKIDVTKEDIKNGEPCQGDECAISKALQRHFNSKDTFTECNFDSGQITLIVDEREYEIKSHDKYKVGDFIDRFDNMDDMDFNSPKPIQFEIEETNENR